MNEEPVVQVPGLRLTVVVDGEEVVMFRIFNGEPVSDALQLVTEWNAHKVVRQAYGIPVGYSLHDYLRTGERPWKKRRNR